jgi:hypothetical protein
LLLEDRLPESLFLLDDDDEEEGVDVGDAAGNAEIVNLSPLPLLALAASSDYAPALEL